MNDLVNNQLSIIKGEYRKKGCSQEAKSLSDPNIIYSIPHTTFSLCLAALPADGTFLNTTTGVLPFVLRA